MFLAPWPQDRKAEEFAEQKKLALKKEAVLSHIARNTAGTAAAAGDRLRGNCHRQARKRLRHP